MLVDMLEVEGLDHVCVRLSGCDDLSSRMLVALPETFADDAMCAIFEFYDTLAI